MCLGKGKPDVPLHVMHKRGDAAPYRKAQVEHIVRREIKEEKTTIYL